LKQGNKVFENLRIEFVGGKVHHLVSALMEKHKVPVATDLQIYTGSVGGILALVTERDDTIDTEYEIIIPEAPGTEQGRFAL
jgi:hypothetical protein